MKSGMGEGMAGRTGPSRQGALLEGLLLVESLNAFAFMKHDFPRFWPMGVVLTPISLAWIGWMSRRTHGYRLADLGLTRSRIGRPV